MRIDIPGWSFRCRIVYDVGMGFLQGLDDYMRSDQPADLFETLLQSGEAAIFHHCDTTDTVGTLAENQPYDVKVRLPMGAPANGGEAPEAPAECMASVESPPGPEPMSEPEFETRTLRKVEILFAARAADRAEITAKMQGTPKPVNALIKIGTRHYIKNKTLYPLMMERQVVFLTLLDGTLLRGLITGFNRYEMRMSLKGGTPITVMRHGVLAAKTKTGRSLLKKDQAVLRDWEKSAFFKSL